jgi:hypothetical protein
MRIPFVPILMAGLVATLLPAADFAAAETRSQERLARLEQAAQRNESEQRTTRGAQPGLKRQTRQIEDAIRRLKAGQNVSTEEIDQILGEVSFERAE